MVILLRSKWMVACIPLVLVVLLGTTCAPAATPPGTPLPPSTQPPSPTAAEATATTATPCEELATPTAEDVGTAALSAEDVPRIGLEELKQLMDSGADITILDNRPRESYEMGHIKGAISLPWSWEGLTEDDLALVPSGTPIVTYCDCGPGEGDSADVAAQLIEMGVSEDVMVLADPSIYGWIEAGYPIE